MGMMGGGKGGAKQPSVPPATLPPEAPSYAADTTAMEAEKTKAQKALMLMKGRQSTILTRDSDLGTPSVGKRTLLGGTA